MDQDNNQTEGLKKLIEKIKDIKTAMFVTADQDGTLRSRPMRQQTIDDDGTIWFFTRQPSGKTEEIKQDAHVNLSYAEPADQKFVSVSGTASLSKDRAKIDELWDPSVKAWFPEGKEDPELTVLKVTPTKGEYWDSSSNVMVHLFGLAKALATGKSYEPGDNQKINVS